MEVHHHPHLPHQGKKRFKEYLLEGIMIFLAVTLGFFAETLRENISHHAREKDYMTSMVEDLQADSAEIADGLHFGNAVAAGLDSLRTALYQPMEKMNEPDIYRMAATYTRLVGISFNEKTSSQLRTGGMSFIRNMKVANAIAGYWTSQKSVDGPAQNYQGRLAAASDLAYTIFNGKYVRVTGKDTLTHFTHVNVDSAARFMTHDETPILVFANRMEVLARMLHNFYLPNLQQQYNRCVSLMAMIREEYHL